MKSIRSAVLDSEVFSPATYLYNDITYNNNNNNRTTERREEGEGGEEEEEVPEERQQGRQGQQEAQNVKGNCF